MSAVPGSGGDAGFTLDAQLREERRAASERRLHTLQIPLMRLAGFGVLCLLATVHGRPGAWPSTPALVALNLGYALAGWALLRLGWRRSRGGVDLSLLLFHLDVVVWLVNLHHVESASLAFGYLLLVRVGDQVGFGFRRAFYFTQVTVVLYLAYGAVVAGFEPAEARWPERLGVAALLWLIGSYIAVTGFVTERLIERTRAAVRAARGLVRSLEERSRELEAARRDADAANRAKSQFLAMISHEIRTPMNGILGTTELLLWSELQGPQRQFAQTAHASAEALLGLIDNLLDLSRIEAGKLAIEPAPLDPRALVEGVLALLQPAAQAKGLVLEARLDPALPERLVGDALRLRQVLLNLVGNAIKFTREGRVEVAVERVGEAPQGRVRFEVRDSGIGVAPDKLASIFEPFTQGDASTTRDFGGSGLGLAIVRQLVGLMGGEVGVASESGRGSTFWFELALPAQEAAPPTAPSPADATDVPLPVPSGTRVLVAEDNEVNQLVLQAMLATLGCEVTVVPDGAAAVAAARAGGYDLVLMDCHMPGTDGYEATRRIRAGEAGDAHLPIVALTASALADDRARCEAAGMDDFLSKPIAIARLAAVLERWVGAAAR